MLEYGHLKRCDQERSDCFAYLVGRCNALNNTKFEPGRVCPFYKNRDKMPGFANYFLTYIARKENEKE